MNTKWIWLLLSVALLGGIGSGVLLYYTQHPQWAGLGNILALAATALMGGLGIQNSTKELEKVRRDMDDRLENLGRHHGFVSEMLHSLEEGKPMSVAIDEKGNVSYEQIGCVTMTFSGASIAKGGIEEPQNRAGGP